jgi:cytochrome c oxidase subunit 2
VTTEEMRQNPDMQEKIENINQFRLENKEAVEARGQDLRYEFDYLLLCNKICGKSHYNMQMKIIVEEQEQFDAWMAEQTQFSASLN